LTHADFILLQPSLQKVELEFRKVVAVAGTPIDEIYFPESGLASIIARTSDGRAAEVGLYGRDGFSGGSLMLGVLHTPHEQVVQMAGSALRIDAVDLISAAAESSSLKSVLLKYVHVAAIQTGYTALANGAYDIQERLARWLLMCDDRADDGVRLTHEFLAIMLSVRRASVTVALQTFEAAGLIRADRGLIVLLDRLKLEEVAGESYGAPEAEYVRLIGPLA
jgi:CRP-like cAMP-binding protein